MQEVDVFIGRVYEFSFSSIEAETVRSCNTTFHARNDRVAATRDADDTKRAQQTPHDDCLDSAFEVVREVSNVCGAASIGF
jgi:hypothetical protein